jgi:co-chaperonin GroES (HSP10)
MQPIIKPAKDLKVPPYLATDEVTLAIKSLEVIEPEKMKVVGFRVLLKVADKDKITKGGIILPASQIDKDLFGSIKATIVKVGSRAFEEEAVEDRPKAGDKVHIAKYAGLPLRDAEFNMYRYANDSDVIAVEE